jgi:hypothetical protein
MSIHPLDSAIYLCIADTVENVYSIPSEFGHVHCILVFGVKMVDMCIRFILYSDTRGDQLGDRKCERYKLAPLYIHIQRIL